MTQARTVVVLEMTPQEAHVVAELLNDLTDDMAGGQRRDDAIEVVNALHDAGYTS